MVRKSVAEKHTGSSPVSGTILLSNTFFIGDNMSEKMQSEINLEIYNRICELVMRHDSSMTQFIYDPRWRLVKEYVFGKCQPHINKNTESGKRTFEEYDWLQELFHRTSYYGYSFFLDVFESVCIAYTKQR